MYGEYEAARAKRLAEEAAAAARQKEAEARHNASVVHTREETKVEILSTSSAYVISFVTKQKFVRRVDTLGSGMEVYGEWLKVGAPWEEQA